MRRRTTVLLGLTLTGLLVAVARRQGLRLRDRLELPADVQARLDSADAPTPDLSGAGYPLRRAGRRLKPHPTAHVAPPAWEPRMLTRLAGWAPTPPRTALTRVAAYAWASPVSLAGLLAGAVSGGRPRLRDGVVVFTGVRGPVGQVIWRRGFAATTLGHVVLARGEPSDSLMVHELVHTRQAERLGPLMGPVYLGLMAVYGYARHPMERAARAAVRQWRSAV